MKMEAYVEVAGLCPPPDPYSYAIKTGETIHLAGQVALDENGLVVGSTPTEQARKIWANIDAVLQAAGSSLADVVKVTYFMRDIREIGEEMEVRKEVFAGRPLPAVTAVQVAALGLPGLMMEVDVVAVTGSG